MEGIVKRLERIWASILVIAAAFIIGIFVCAEKRGGNSEQVQGMSKKTIEQVQKEHTPLWMAIPGVEGTAIGLSDNKPCIKIFTSVRPHELQGKIPSVVEGYTVIIKETGTFHALDQQ